MNIEATKAVENRIGDLLDAFGTKTAIRDSVTDWFIQYATSKKFTRMSRKQKAKAISDYRNLFEFFK